MMRALENDEADLAIALTEGITARIIGGAKARILQLYVESPLTWGIHVSASGPLESLSQLQGQRFAISRPYSGSHLMAFVLAEQQGWPTEQLPLVEVGGLGGARAALANEEAEVFLWEKYTTKPIVDRGEFRRVAEINTPWPCFALVASEKALNGYNDTLDKVQRIINESSGSFKDRPEALDLISDRYELESSDAEAWLSRTRWADHRRISASMLQNVIETLYRLSAIDTQKKPEELCAPGVILT
jgi:ABC-type nitrate/sulfonate/bicarbonate transport system substrate-binding protein